ncbi:hypothetical protein P3X46_019632 [Hevea brasiliensis]|uniref:Uncharacterized protein n=1 Tax=Hevea brasiliensis TaxID=3981 RepID=A0ABQ9LL64_HEVBR|nr:hypothetical protein P3X46_019632 [Hevea brasiliensis]
MLQQNLKKLYQRLLLRLQNGRMFQAYIEAAEIMLEDDVASNKVIGSHGAIFIQNQLKNSDRLSILTRCNTGVQPLSHLLILFIKFNSYYGDLDSQLLSWCMTK